jgi:hypothetical protein
MAYQHLARGRSMIACFTICKNRGTGLFGGIVI